MRQFNCVRLLLLLGVMLTALSPVVATARSREFLGATIGDQELDPARHMMNILTNTPLEVAAKDAEETITRRRMHERLNYRRFRTRKAHFGGHIPFTSDYEFLGAAIDDQELDPARRTMNILTDVPSEVAAKDAEETTRRRMHERLNYRRFGTRRAHFGGRIPFTSDYGRIKRHPPRHN